MVERDQDVTGAGEVDERCEERDGDDRRKVNDVCDCLCGSSSFDGFDVCNGWVLL